MGANWEANVLSQKKCLNKLRCLSQNDSFKRASYFVQIYNK